VEAFPETNRNIYLITVDNIGYTKCLFISVNSSMQ